MEWGWGAQCMMGDKSGLGRGYESGCGGAPAGVGGVSICCLPRVRASKSWPGTADTGSPRLAGLTEALCNKVLSYLEPTYFMVHGLRSPEPQTGSDIGVR